MLAQYEVHGRWTAREVVAGNRADAAMMEIREGPILVADNVVEWHAPLIERAPAMARALKLLIEGWLDGEERLDGDKVSRAIADARTLLEGLGEREEWYLDSDPR